MEIDPTPTYVFDYPWETPRPTIAADRCKGKCQDKSLFGLIGLFVGLLAIAAITGAYVRRRKRKQLANTLSVDGYQTPPIYAPPERQRHSQDMNQVEYGVVGVERPASSHQRGWGSYRRSP
ncbi:hypothetical protein FQN53_000290 [Emmonsiellopsis sp. PD_33]|nr:hypothetical protein FQN53_000290 [Emmonsiellopsis sp. PD_33]